MDFYYINSKNEKLDFSTYPYIFQEGDFMDYSWQYDSVEGERYNKVTKFRRGIGERSFKLALMPDFKLSLEDRKKKLLQYADHIYRVFETDVVNHKEGKLYTSTGYYLPCVIVSSTKEMWNSGLPFMFQTFKIVSANNAWIKEEEKHFFSSTESIVKESVGALDYPHDYLFDYASQSIGVSYWNIGHITDCDFQMVIYGPIIDPEIIINNHPYKLFVELDENEHAIIDTRNNTVIKHTASGEEINIYDLRSKESSIFEPLPSNEVMTIIWNGSFGFDITAYIERGEPEWN